ncbi:MAG: hypothetical protein GEV28_34520 [Actinophytocola sp.]|uniref:hypothetical protein n=1 Tax=Actinophytocola sp. TaxID=1872138 RepID=UPI001322BA9C|nr:hypothetical protein [Actinophytocola sp.]MPZ85230.1 hypothetical protein [Actinophytocola sp.]
MATEWMRVGCAQTGPEGDELSHLDLLSSALHEAMDAHRQGVIVGPVVDEVALARAARRARRRDTTRALHTVPGGAA